MRRNYIDWLRNLCILYLLPFHAARIFDGNEANYVQGIPNMFTTNLVLLSFWFMPLMFLLAGMSSYFSLSNRSNNKYLKERLLRLFVPLFIGIIVVMPPQGYVAMKFHYGYSGSFFGYIKKFFTDFSDLSGYFGSFTPGPLWFILYLFIISIVLLPVMRRILISDNLRNNLVNALNNPQIIALMGIPITIASALPDIGGKNIFIYGAITLLGFLLVIDDKICEGIEKCKLYYLLITIVGVVIMLVEKYITGWYSGFSTLGILCSLVYYSTIWISLLAFIGYGKTYLNFSSKYIRYFSKAAFPFYIVHQTYLIIIGYFILKITSIFLVQYISIILLTFIASILTYEIVKRFKVTKFLFGIK